MMEGLGGGLTDQRSECRRLVKRSFPRKFAFQLPLTKLHAHFRDRPRPDGLWYPLHCAGNADAL